MDKHISIPASYAGEINLDKLITNLKHIPLYIDSGVEYLNSIDKIRIFDNEIYILQEKDLNIFIYKFSMSGELKNYFEGSKGKFKLYSASDLVVDNSGVYVTDIYDRSVSIFDHSLSFMSKLNLNINLGLKNLRIHGGRIIARVDLSEKIGNIFSILYSCDIKNGDCMPIKSMADLITQKGIGINLMYFENFHYSNDLNEFIYTDLLNSNFYLYKDDKLLEKIQISFPDNVWIGKEERDKMKSLSDEEIGMMLVESNKGFAIKYAFKYEKFIVFTFTVLGKRYYCIVNIDEKSCVYYDYNIFTNEKNYIDDTAPLNNICGMSQDGKIIYTTEFEIFKYYHSEKSSSQKSIVEFDEENICTHIISLGTVNSRLNSMTNLVKH